MSALRQRRCRLWVGASVRSALALVSTSVSVCLLSLRQRQHQCRLLRSCRLQCYCRPCVSVSCGIHVSIGFGIALLPVSLSALTSASASAFASASALASVSVFASASASALISQMAPKKTWLSVASSQPHSNAHSLIHEPPFCIGIELYLFHDWNDSFGDKKKSLFMGIKVNLCSTFSSSALVGF